MSESALASYVQLSPNCTKPRQGQIRGVAIHCTAGGRNLPARRFADMARFTTYDRKHGASCHYVVGGDGSIAQVCDERNRAWCTSDPIDHELITIEVASDADEPNRVNTEAVAALIRLLVDVCQRNGIPKLLWKGDKSLMGQWDQQNMVVHRWTAAKACPGDALYQMHGGIAAAVNDLLEEAQAATRKEDKSDMERKAIKAIVEEVLAERESMPVPAWAESEFQAAIAAGITDGTAPMGLIPRYQAAIMAFRARNRE